MKSLIAANLQSKIIGSTSIMFLKYEDQPYLMFLKQDISPEVNLSFSLFDVSWVVEQSFQAN